MATPYSQTVRSLALDAQRTWIASIFVVTVLAAAWTAWAFGAELGVYATSLEARVERSQGGHPVVAQVTGQVDAVLVTVGQLVDEGEVLMTLEARDSRWILAGAEQRAVALAGRLASLEGQLAAEEAASREARRAEADHVEEQSARQREAETLVELADAEVEWALELREAGLVSAAELLRAQSVARQRRWAAQAQEVALRRLEWTHRSQASERAALIEAVRAEVAGVKGALAETDAEIERLRLGVARHEIRAPIAGQVGEREALTLGAVVEAGERVATIVPEGGLRVVAFFDPAQAIGRIVAGQSALVRLEGFPWAQFGALQAEVTSVASEPRRARARVELEPVAGTGRVPPAAHGQPATVEVEVERVPAATLFLRTLGGRFGSPR